MTLSGSLSNAINDYLKEKRMKAEELDKEITLLLNRYFYEGFDCGGEEYGDDGFYIDDKGIEEVKKLFLSAGWTPPHD